MPYGLFCEAKRAFPPTGDYRMWEASLEMANPPPPPRSASAAFEALGCRCPVFLVLAPACAALRFGLLLSTLSRLTHIL